MQFKKVELSLSMIRWDDNSGMLQQEMDCMDLHQVASASSVDQRSTSMMKRVGRQGRRPLAEKAQ